MGDKTGAAIVVVDDDASWRHVLQVALRRAGYEVHLVGDPRTALQTVIAARPAAVVVDYAMPHLDGVALATQLHEALGEACPPLLAVTGSVERVRDHPSHGRLAVILPKPVALTTLLAELRRVVVGRTRSGTHAAAGTEPGEPPHSASG